jgi:hypothetical protein
MKHARQISSLLVVAASLLVLAACGQKTNCSGISFGASGSGGSGVGGLSTSGSVCGLPTGNGTGGAKALLFFQQQGNILNTALFSGTAMTTLTGGSVPSLGNGAGADMVVVNKSFLYLTWLPQGGSSGQVLAFAINRSSGVLTPITGSPFDTKTSKVDTIVADPGGRFLVVGNSVSGDLSSFKIDSATGVLTLTPNSPLANPNLSPTNLAIDGTGSYVYSTEVAKIGDVFGFVVNQTTFDLSPMASSPFFLGVTKVAGEPSGQFMIGVDGSSNVDVIGIEQGTGALTSKVPYPSTHAGDSILVHPTGKFVYVYSIGNPLEGFSFSAGALTPLTGSPFSTLPILHPCKLDQNGTVLFGYTVTGGFGARNIDPATGAVTGGVPDLSVTSSPNFAATN